MLLSLSFQSNPSLNRVEPLHNFCWYVAEGSCCKLRSCFLRSSSVHAMSNKVPVWAVACVHSPSDMICFFQLAILMAKALSYANVIEERNIVKETCGNDWKEMPWASNTKKKRNFRFFCGLVIFSINTRNSWRTFAELHDGTTDGESSCLTCEQNLMEQDSLNVTAKFKATVELLVDIHGTVACCLCRHFELLTALKMPWTFALSQTVTQKSFSILCVSGEDFIVGFTRIPCAYQT